MLGKTMIDRLKAWLKEASEEGSRDRDGIRLACAALLMEAAQIDGDLEDRERDVVRRLLERRFGLSPDQAAALAAAAEQKAEHSAQLFGFTRLVNEQLSRARRIELLEMLWEVAYADGVLDPLEDAMLRRVGGLVDVSDHERGEARLRVLRRLGIAESG
jgi:uncharacterized tellurite resistance protein B-like protein